MLSETSRLKIRSAFDRNALRIRSVSPEGEIEWREVQKTVEARTEGETILRLVTETGEAIVTAGHRIYVETDRAVEAETLVPGDRILSRTSQGNLDSTRLLRSEILPGRETMYDVSVEGNRNLFLHRSGILVHNCPDRLYRFAPPESERNIGSYNRVFGRVWEDDELHDYLTFGLDWWNMMPPMTESLNTLDRLLAEKPVWRTAVLWAALSHACFALATNWVHEEFSLTGDSYVKLFYDGRELDIRLDHLYLALFDPMRRTPDQRVLSMVEERRFRAAWTSGAVYVDSVDALTNRVERRRVTAVYRHRTPFKRMVSVTLSDGRSVSATIDHSLFLYLGGAIVPVQAGDLAVGKTIATVALGAYVEPVEILSLIYLPPEEYTYDLSVPGNENFVLSNGVLAHNSYSIGGISLDIERSSKYESLKQNAESQFDKAAEAKARTVKMIRGIQQPKYGIGVRSAFGSFTGRGILSPRNFLVLPFILVFFQILHGSGILA